MLRDKTPFKQNGEKIMLSIQDQGLTTRVIKHLHNNATDPTHMFSKQQLESLAISFLAVTLLKQGEYTTRHNKIYSQIPWNSLDDKNIRSEKYC